MSNNQEHLKVFLGAEKYDELLSTAKGMSAFGRKLTDMSDQELMVTLVLLQDQHTASLRIARQMGRYEGTVRESGIAAE